MDEWTFIAKDLAGDFEVLTTFEHQTNDIKSGYWKGVLPIIQEYLRYGYGSTWVSRMDWWGWCDKFDSNDKLTYEWDNDNPVNINNQNRDISWSTSSNEDVTFEQFE